MTARTQNKLISRTAVHAPYIPTPSSPHNAHPTYPTPSSPHNVHPTYPTPSSPHTYPTLCYPHSMFTTPHTRTTSCSIHNVLTTPHTHSPYTAPSISSHSTHAQGADHTKYPNTVARPSHTHPILSIHNVLTRPYTHTPYPPH